MFVIRPKYPSEWANALALLAYYYVKIELESKGDVAHMLVSEADHSEGMSDPEDDLHLAEMAFQMNWRQEGMVCPHCAFKKEEVCGHLTFGSVIDCSAFDRALSSTVVKEIYKCKNSAL